MTRTLASDLIPILMFYLTPLRHTERYLPKDDSSQRQGAEGTSRFRINRV